MSAKIMCGELRTAGNSVYLEIPVFRQVHVLLINFLYDLESWSDSDMLKVDTDYENIEGFKSYEFLEGKKYNIHLLIFGGQEGRIHLMIELRDPHRKGILLKKIGKHFNIASLPAPLLYVDNDWV